MSWWQTDKQDWSMPLPRMASREKQLTARAPTLAAFRMLGTLVASNCDDCYKSAKQGVLTRAQDLFCEAGEVWFFNAEGVCC